MPKNLSSLACERDKSDIFQLKDVFCCAFSVLSLSCSLGCCCWFWWFWWWKRDLWLKGSFFCFVYSEIFTTIEWEERKIYLRWFREDFEMTSFKLNVNGVGFFLILLAMNLSIFLNNFFSSFFFICLHFHTNTIKMDQVKK